MIDQAQTDKFKDILQLSKNTLVIFPGEADLDLFLASYSLFYFLNNGHYTRILTQEFKTVLPKEIKDLIDAKLIETELGKENLLISFPYQEEQVDKVSYYIGENDKRFYLTIKPKRGVAPLNSKNIEFSYAGVQADLIVLCGVEDLEKLEQLYFAYENLYKGTDNQLVTINDFIPDFGKLNLDISPANSYCEAVYNLIKSIDENSNDLFARTNLPTLLLYGIEAKNDGLQSPFVAAPTFSTVAELINFGAVRLFKKEIKSSDLKQKKSTKNKEVVVTQQH